MTDFDSAGGDEFLAPPRPSAERPHIVLSEAERAGFNLHVAVERVQAAGGTLGLGKAHLLFGVENLPLQVADAHQIVVHEAQSAHTRGGEIDGGRRAQASHAHHEHLGVHQFLLA